MEDRLKKIKLFLFDVDGILTDGRIIFDSNGIETKAFDVKDGHGLKLLQRSGIRLGIITGRQSPVTRIRAEELNIEIVYQGAKVKLLPYQEILRSLELTDGEVAYMGDDLVDLPILKRVGFAATVPTAVNDIKPYVDYITTVPAGRGAVREVCDYFLKKTGRWDEVTARYFGGENSDIQNSCQVD